MNNGEQFFNTSAAGGYAISRSLRFNSSDSAYLSRTPASAGNRKTFTFAAWVKLSKITGYCHAVSAGPDSNTASCFSFSENGSTTGLNDLSFFDYQSGGYTTRLNSTAVFRDPSSWYHIILAVDTTQSTASNRIKIYVNGTQLTSFATATYPSQNTDLVLSNNVAHLIGTYTNSKYRYSDAYLADVHFIDGQALDPTSFGQFDDNGIWQPIEYTGTYGTNGFHLPFSDNSTAAALGTDTSGNGNDWTVNNISVAAGAGNDSLVDVPTNGTETDTGVGGEVRGNYCTWNPLAKGSNTTLSNGNLDMSSGAFWQTVVGTMGVTSGKWYWEQTMTSNQYSYTGICNQNFIKDIQAEPPGDTTNSWGYLTSSGTAYYDQGGGAEISVSLTAMGASGGTLGIALDLDNQKLWFALDGTWMGVGSPDPATGASATFTNLTAGHTYFPAADVYDASASFNFGQRPFAYTAPSGFKALNTANLGDPVITKPSEYMDVALYTGNGSTQTISGLEFSPDLVWVKSRSNAISHFLYDQVRGFSNGNAYELRSNSTNAEAVPASASVGLTSFNSDGFSLGSDPGANTNAATYVSWNWDAGSSTVTNNDGSITSSVRANPSAGFSIVTFTKVGGSSVSHTVGHGLGAEPHLILVKNRNTVDDWYVYTKALGNGSRVSLNSTAAQVTGTNVWGSTTPTSSVFTVRSLFDDPHVAYCFAPVEGYSAFGSYTGNGSNDGSFIFTGFAVKYLLVKCTSDAGQEWVILDNSRSPYNVTDDALYANASDAEASNSTRAVDLLSNGFKFRNGSSGATDFSGRTYIYAAFAENPFALNARAR